jgi:uncharacterized BrkB/YihY/UPF0761 family membrane protein
MMLRAYHSMLILLFGARFTFACAKRLRNVHRALQ